MKRALFILAMLTCACGFAQNIEDWIEASPDPEALQAWLDELRQMPLDLNAATETEIAALPFFDERAAKAVIAERTVGNGFGSLGEALAVTELSREQRRVLSQFAGVTVDRKTVRTNAWFSAGYGGEPSEATPDAMWGRGRASFLSAGKRTGYLSVRRQAEDPALFEQAAVGLEMRPHRMVPHLMAGNFQYEAGTGLVFASSYGMANWLSSPDAVKPGEAGGLILRPSTSTRRMYRGAAVNVNWSPVDAVVLGSWNRMNGALGDSGATGLSEGQSSSTALDRARRDQIEERLFGFCVQTGFQGWRAGIAGYNAHYSPTFIPVVTSSSLPDFSGSSLRAGSLFLAMNGAGFGAMTELAGSYPGGRAIQGALFAQDSHAGVTLYHMNADANFFSPHSAPWGGFGEDASNQQSTGVRIRASWPQHTLLFSGHVDKTPYRTATYPLSKPASEIEARWTTTLSKPLEIDVLGRRGWTDDGSSTLPARRVRVDRGRVEVRWSAQEEYRVRFEIRTAERDGQKSHGVGTLLFFQAKARVLDSGVYARLTFFGLEEDGSGLPLQVYEGSIIGVYPLVGLSGSGRRVTTTVSHHWGGVAASVQAAQATYHAGGRDHSTFDVAFGLGYRR
ncbi:MAG TPA: hypothetical protein VGL38_01900 [bacterium]